LDRHFGTAGIVISDFGVGGSGALALALQRDGRLLAAGNASFWPRVMGATYRHLGLVGDGISFGVAASKEVASLLRLIGTGDRSAATEHLEATPSLAMARLLRTHEFFIAECHAQVYEGDTALHAAAFAYDTDIARSLVERGADVRARNRRGAEPLHAAAIGVPGSASWNPTRQQAVISYLIEMGADPNAAAVGGATPLHRAARNRCSAAVAALLCAGADPRLANDNGSTAFELAHWTTGRGGVGSIAAKAEQLAPLARGRRPARNVGAASPATAWWWRRPSSSPAPGRPWPLSPEQSRWGWRSGCCREPWWSQGVATAGLRQRLVPDELAGRVVAAVRMLSYGAAPLGAQAGGALARTWGLRAPYAAGAVAVLAATALARPALRT
jgi:hypothetical protein